MSFWLKRAASASVLGFVCLAFSGSYVPGFEAHPAGHFPFAYVQDACGPADGSALEFYFTVKEAECGKYGEPFVMVSIIADLPKSAPRDYSIGSDGRVALALASRCLKPGQCEGATSGSLHLGKFVGHQGASGEYELRFRDGSVEKGRFDAVWCYVRLECG